MDFSGLSSSELCEVLHRKTWKIRIRIVFQIQFESAAEMSNHQDYSSNLCVSLISTFLYVYSLQAKTQETD